MCNERKLPRTGTSYIRYKLNMSNMAEHLNQQVITVGTSLCSQVTCITCGSAGWLRHQHTHINTHSFNGKFAHGRAGCAV